MRRVGGGNLVVLCVSCKSMLDGGGTMPVPMKMPAVRGIGTDAHGHNGRMPTGQAKFSGAAYLFSQGSLLVSLP